MLRVKVDRGIRSVCQRPGWRSTASRGAPGGTWLSLEEWKAGPWARAQRDAVDQWRCLRSGRPRRGFLNLLPRWGSCGHLSKVKAPSETGWGRGPGNCGGWAVLELGEDLPESVPMDWRMSGLPDNSHATPTPASTWVPRAEPPRRGPSNPKMPAPITVTVPSPPPLAVWPFQTPLGPRARHEAPQLCGRDWVAASSPCPGRPGWRSGSADHVHSRVQPPGSHCGCSCLLSQHPLRWPVQG